MKPYGVPRNLEVQYPDMGSIAEYGLNAGRLDKRASQRSKRKRASRRIWKRIARIENKKAAQEELKD